MNNFFDQTVADVYDRYQARLSQAGAMDFDDLLVNAVRLLEDVPDVREHWTNAFRWVHVDEYQDTNHAQYRIVRALASKHGNVCVVGDSDQSIYSWRGADIRNMLDFEKDFPNATTIRLERNYRSTQKILDAANAVIEQNRERQPKRLWSDLGAGEAVRIVEAEDERAEARYVVGRIASLLETGHSAEELAVFYRTNAQSRVIEDALLGADIPYRVIGGTKFYDRAEVKDAMAYLRVLVNPADTVSLRRVVNSPRRGIGDTTVSRLVQHAEAMGVSLRDALREAEAVLPGAAAQRNVRDFSALLDELAEGIEDAPVAQTLERVLDKSGYREHAARGAHHRGAGTAGEPRRARGRGPRVRRALRRRRAARRGGARRLPAGAVAGRRRRRRPRRPRPLDGHADDDPQREGPRVPRRVPGRHGGDGLPARPGHRGQHDRGGAPALLRGHDPRRAVADDDLLPHAHPLRPQREQRAVALPGGDRRAGGGARAPAAGLRPAADGRASLLRAAGRSAAAAAAVAGSRAGCATRGRPRPTKPLGVEPKEDHELPLLATGDTVRHKTWGEGVVIQVATAEEVVVRFPDQGEKRLHVAYAPIEKV